MGKFGVATASTGSVTIEPNGMAFSEVTFTVPSGRKVYGIVGVYASNRAMVVTEMAFGRLPMVDIGLFNAHATSSITGTVELRALIGPS